MKQIKFRIYDKDRKLMEEVGAIDWASDGFPITVNTKTKKYYRPECGEEHLQIMQFTGLLDKNGREIYEGDIVSFFYKEEETRYEIVFIENTGRYELLPKNGIPQPLPDMDRSEVIGNIYEHPELLESYVF